MMTINEEGKALVEQKGFNKEEALKEFMDYVHSYLGDDECDQIMKAFTLADKAHEGQFRASGTVYHASSCSGRDFGAFANRSYYIDCSLAPRCR